MDKQTFGHALTTIRTARGITKANLARQAKLHRQSIQAYEAGEHSPSIEILCRLADALDCSLDELTGRSPRNGQPV